MRGLILVAILAVPALGACETFDPYSVDYRLISDQEGVAVYSNEMEDISGSRWLQFSADNRNSFPACVQVRFDGDGETSGHSMGDVIRLEASGSADIGYVNLPASFNPLSQVWNVGDDGNCGYPPK